MNFIESIEAEQSLNDRIKYVKKLDLNDYQKLKIVSDKTILDNANLKFLDQNERILSHYYKHDNCESKNKLEFRVYDEKEIEQIKKVKILQDI